MGKEVLSTGVWNHIKSNSIIYSSSLVGGIGGAVYGYNSSNGDLAKTGMYAVGGITAGVGLGFGLRGQKQRMAPKENLEPTMVQPKAGWHTPNYEGANKWKGDVHNYYANKSPDVEFYNKTQLPQLAKRLGLKISEMDLKISELEKSNADLFSSMIPF